MRRLGWLIFGIIFGMSLSKVEATKFEKIYRLFLFKDFTLMGVIVTAVIVGIIGFYLLSLMGNKTIDNKEIIIDYSPLRWQHIIGGLIFGTGWAMTGS